MEKNRKLVLALPVLIGTAVIVWLPNFNSSDVMSRKTKKDGGQGVLSAQELSALAGSLSSPRNIEVISGEWGERNPFDGGPIVQKSPQMQKNPIIENSAEVYHVNGIFWNETRPSVIINDSVYYIGSKFGSVLVKEIRPEEVVLSDGTKEVIIKLRQDDLIEMDGKR